MLMTLNVYVLTPCVNNEAMNNNNKAFIQINPQYYIIYTHIFIYIHIFIYGYSHLSTKKKVDILNTYTQLSENK